LLTSASANLVEYKILGELGLRFGSRRGGRGARAPVPLATPLGMVYLSLMLMLIIQKGYWLD